MMSAAPPRVATVKDAHAHAHTHAHTHAQHEPVNAPSATRGRLAAWSPDTSHPVLKMRGAGTPGDVSLHEEVSRLSAQFCESVHTIAGLEAENAKLRAALANVHATNAREEANASGEALGASAPGEPLTRDGAAQGAVAAYTHAQPHAQPQPLPAQEGLLQQLAIALQSLSGAAVARARSASRGRASSRDQEQGSDDEVCHVQSSARDAPTPSRARHTRERKSAVGSSAPQASPPLSTRPARVSSVTAATVSSAQRQTVVSRSPPATQPVWAVNTSTASAQTRYIGNGGRRVTSPRGVTPTPANRAPAALSRSPSPRNVSFAPDASPRPRAPRGSEATPTDALRHKRGLAASTASPARTRTPPASRAGAASATRRLQEAPPPPPGSHVTVSPAPSRLSSRPAGAHPAHAASATRVAATSAVAHASDHTSTTRSEAAGTAAHAPPVRAPMVLVLPPDADMSPAGIAALLVRMQANGALPVPTEGAASTSHRSPLPLPAGALDVTANSSPARMAITPPPGMSHQPPRTTTARRAPPPPPVAAREPFYSEPNDAGPETDGRGTRASASLPQLEQLLRNIAARVQVEASPGLSTILRSLPFTADDVDAARAEHVAATDVSVMSLAPRQPVLTAPAPPSMSDLQTLSPLVFPMPPPFRFVDGSAPVTVTSNSMHTGVPAAAAALSVPAPAAQSAPLALLHRAHSIRGTLPKFRAIPFTERAAASPSISPGGDTDGSSHRAGSHTVGRESIGGVSASQKRDTGLEAAGAAAALTVPSFDAQDLWMGTSDHSMRAVGAPTLDASLDAVAAADVLSSRPSAFREVPPFGSAAAAVAAAQQKSMEADLWLNRVDSSLHYLEAMVTGPPRDVLRAESLIRPVPMVLKSSEPPSTGAAQLFSSTGLGSAAASGPSLVEGGAARWRLGHNLLALYGDDPAMRMFHVGTHASESLDATFGVSHRA